MSHLRDGLNWFANTVFFALSTKLRYFASNMTQDLDKIRREAHFLPEIDEELQLIAQQDNRSVKGLLEWLALDYIKKRTGKKFINKIKSKTR